ncbi:MAG: ABC transporter permease [Anaerolineae bacterium]
MNGGPLDPQGDGPAPARGRAWARAATVYGAPTLLALGLLAAWEVVVVALAVPGWLLPAPSKVALATWEMRDLLWLHGRQTLVEAWLGLGLALVGGLVLALLIDVSPMLRRTLYPLLVTSQTVPILAIAPLFIIWFGFGLLPKVLIVALVCFFPIAVNTADGLRAVDPDLMALLRSMGASRWQILAKVRLPSALPSFFSGLRVAVTYSIVGAVIGEWVGASEGLGIFMLRAQRSYMTDRVFAAIVVTSALSIAMFLAISALERVALPWYHTASRSQQWEELTPGAEPSGGTADTP